MSDLNWRAVLQNVAAAPSRTELVTSLTNLQAALRHQSDNTNNNDTSFLLDPPYHLDRLLLWCLDQQQQQASDYHDFDHAVLTLDCFTLLWKNSNSKRAVDSMAECGPQVLDRLLLGGSFRNNPTSFQLLRLLCIVPKLKATIATDLHSWIVADSFGSEPFDQDEKKEDDHLVVASEFRGSNENDDEVPQKLELIKELSTQASRTDQLQLYKLYGNWVMEHLAVEPSTRILWNWVSSLPHVLLSPAQLLWTALPEMVGTGSDIVQRLRNLTAIVGNLVHHIQTALESNPLTVRDSILQLEQQEWLVPWLFTWLPHHDTVVTRRSTRTLRCLAQFHLGQDMIRRDAPLSFVTTLLQTLDNPDLDTQILACQALNKVLDILERHEVIRYGPGIETALMGVVEHSTSEQLVLAAVDGLTSIVRISPWKRSANSFSDEFFEHLLMVLHEQLDQPSYHKSVALFLRQLLQVKENEFKIPQITSVLATNHSVLEILSLLLAPTHPECDASRSIAMTLLQQLLSNNAQHLQSMAEDEHLLTGLVNVCLNHDGRLKDTAKEMVLTLVPEL